MRRSPGSDAAELVPASLPVVAQLAGVASARPWLTELPQLMEQVRTAFRLRLSALLHGDLNPGNVLSAGDGRWLAIDPKPLIGDPAYDPWPLLEQVDDPFGYPDPARVLRDRVDLVAAELALDPQRIVRWSLARRVEAALWAAQHGDVPGGAAIMREARTLADL